MNKVFFPNLNGIRFLAAFAVFLHHFEQYRYIFGLDHFFHIPFFDGIGKLAVVCFFVLSGFLITYLLMEEKQVKSTINLKKFYIRRILRIWPVYFLLVIVGFLVLPRFSVFHVPDWSEHLSGNFYIKFLFYLLILPNLIASFTYPIPNVTQSWSLGTEDQFYLAWPFIIKKSHKLLSWFVGIIVVYLIIKLSIALLESSFPTERGKFFWSSIQRFWNFFAVDCMALGGIGAYLAHKKPIEWFRFIFSKPFQIVLYSLTIFLLLIDFKVPVFKYEMYAILFILIILNAAWNPKTLINFEFEPFKYMGKISYGFYMYHPAMIVFIINIFMPLGWTNYFVLFASSLSLAVLFSAFSFEFYEKGFLISKNKFTVVESGIHENKNKTLFFKLMRLIKVKNPDKKNDD
jgi:peptidoglycan/LPS O-acetylase OafA/YrhL